MPKRILQGRGRGWKKCPAFKFCLKCGVRFNPYSRYTKLCSDCNPRNLQKIKLDQEVKQNEKERKVKSSKKRKS